VDRTTGFLHLGERETWREQEAIHPQIDSTRCIGGYPMFATDPGGAPSVHCIRGESEFTQKLYHHLDGQIGGGAPPALLRTERNIRCEHVVVAF
jgi:hypothetical protein